MENSGATFYIAEAEGGRDSVNWAELVSALAPYKVPKAIVTNFNPFIGANNLDDFRLAKPLVDAGWACLTEAYIGDNPQATPENLHFRGTRLGWDNTQPVFGVYGPTRLVDYQEWLDWPGWSAYLAEYLW